MNAIETPDDTHKEVPATVREALTDIQATLADLRERRDRLAVELAQVNGQLKDAAKEAVVLSRLVARYEESPDKPASGSPGERRD